MKKYLLFLLTICSLVTAVSCKRGTITDPLECQWSINLLYKDKNTGENLVSQNEPFILESALQSKFIFTNNGDTVRKNFCCSSVENENILEIKYYDLCSNMDVLSGRSWNCHFTIQYQDLSMSPDTFRIEYDRNSDIHTASLYFNDTLLEKKELLYLPYEYQIIFNPQTIEK